MIPIKMRLINKAPLISEIYKQTTFGTALGLTRTAKEAQKESVQSIKSTFTTRGTWFNQNMRHGIKVEPATKNKLQAMVHTEAYWLEPHETGSDKRGTRSRLGVPTAALRPKGSRKILKRDLRPRALLAAGKAFVLPTRRGDVIAQFKGKAQRLVILYGLEQKVRIRKQSTFYEPIDRTVKDRIDHNVAAGLEKAFATARFF